MQERKQAARIEIDTAPREEVRRETGRKRKTDRGRGRAEEEGTVGKRRGEWHGRAEGVRRNEKKRDRLGGMHRAGRTDADTP